MNLNLHDLLDTLKLLISAIIIWHIWNNYSLSNRFDEPEEFNKYAKTPGEETKPLNAKKDLSGS